MNNLSELIMADQKIKAIIVDDEERARNSLRLLLRNYCPEVEVIDTAANVPDAVLAINKHRPDLVFLDIEMLFQHKLIRNKNLKWVHYKMDLLSMATDFHLKQRI